MKTKKDKKCYKIIFYLIFLGVFGFFVKNASASPITEMNVLGLVNQARIENGLRPLEANEKLFSAASDKADDMIKNNYFAHTSPQGATPWVWFKKEGYDYKFAGENLAINFSSAETQQKAWMESETHRKNILDENFQEIGLAVKRGIVNGKLTTITVQEFGTQMNFVGGDSLQKIKEKSDELVPIKNSLPKIDTNLLQNFNSQLLKAGENLTSAIGAKNSFKNLNFIEYLRSGASAVILTIIVINTLILFWIIASSIASLKRKKDGIPAKFSLYNISQDEYLEFLKQFSVSPEKVKTLYLKSMKLHKQKS